MSVNDDNNNDNSHDDQMNVDSNDTNDDNNNNNTVKLKSGLTGIKNEGATCYLNSLIQSLYMTPEFRRKLFQLDVIDDLHATQAYFTSYTRIRQDDGGVTNMVDGGGPKPRKVVLRLQQLFAHMQNNTRHSLVDNLEYPLAVSTRALTDSFGWSENQLRQQHDVSELNRILLDAIKQSLVGTSGATLIDDLYSGELLHRIESCECEHFSERLEGFLDLQMIVQGCSSLEESLAAYFAPEMLDGDNKWRCDQCGRKVEAMKRVSFKRVPPMLTVGLLRFGYDWNNGRRTKITDGFTFPMELEIPIVGSDELTVYELFSVIVHKGGAYKGHYTANIRDLMDEGQWSNAEARTRAPKKGSRVSRSGGAAGSEDKWSNAAPVQAADNLAEFVVESVVKIIVTKGGSHGRVPFSKLTSLFQQEYGTSWSKMYKKRFGTMSKFIRKNGGVFHVDVSGHVSLAAPEDHVEKHCTQEITTTATKKSPTNGVKTRSSSKKVESPTNGKNAPSSPKKGTPMKKKRKKKVEVKDPHPGWFAFNDDIVFPIMSKKLRDQFGGRGKNSECAYMLMYRKRSEKPLSTPQLPEYLQEALLREQQGDVSDSTTSTKVSIVVSVCTKAGVSRHFQLVESTITPTGLVSRLREFVEHEASDESVRVLYTNKSGEVLLLSELHEFGAVNLESVGEICVEIDEGTWLEERGRRFEMRCVPVIVPPPPSELNGGEMSLRVKWYVSMDATLNELLLNLSGWYSTYTQASWTHDVDLPQCASVLDAFGNVFDDYDSTVVDAVVPGEGVLLKLSPLPDEARGEILIHWYCAQHGKIDGSQQRQSVVCTLDDTVLKAKEKAMRVFGLDEHTLVTMIRKSTRTKKKSVVGGAIVHDERQTLRSLNCEMNDTLMLETAPGNARSDFTLCLIQRVPSTHATTTATTPSTTRKARRKKSNGSVSEPVCPFRLSPANQHQVGELVLPFDASVEDVKEHAMRLLTLDDESSAKCIRLSLMDKYGQPSQVLRNSGACLKDLGVRGGHCLFVQVLPEEESLRVNDKLVYLVERDVKRKLYHVERQIECVLSLDDHSSLMSVRKVIGRLVDDTTDNDTTGVLRLAYYDMHKLKWVEFITPKSAKSRGKQAFTKQFKAFSRCTDHTIIAYTHSSPHTRAYEHDWPSAFDFYFQKHKPKPLAQANAWIEDDFEALTIQVDV